MVNFLTKLIQRLASPISKALSFTNLSAEELGTKMLQWGAADWNQGPVNTKRVQRSKKNKGRKRAAWMAEVKAYHAGRGKGSAKGFPDAPWWKPPVEEAVAAPSAAPSKGDDDEEEEEEEPEVLFVEPLLKKPKKDDDNDEGGNDFSFNSEGGRGFCAVFGP